MVRADNINRYADGNDKKLVNLGSFFNLMTMNWPLAVGSL